MRLRFHPLVVTILLGCNGPITDVPARPAPGAPTFESVLEAPPSLSSVVLPESERTHLAPSTPAHVQSLRVACGTCHDGAPERPLPTRPENLQQLHRGLVFRHGELACASCHTAGQPPRLHLSTGENVETAEALRLCAQCHGPQWRDFQHGAHGGMRGHWDLSAGPRERNHCVSCHDPHAPRFVGGQPVLPPRDRLLPTHSDEAHP